MKKHLLTHGFLILFSAHSLFAQNNFVAGVETGINKGIKPENVQLICDTVFSFSTLGTFPAGITTDGNFIWCADNNFGDIYKYSFTGMLAGTIPNPAAPYVANPGGDIDFDGTNLLLMSEETDTLYKIDPNTGMVVSKFRVAPCATGCFGVAFDGAYIWVTDYGTAALYKLNAVTGMVINTFPVSAPSALLPIKFINGRLYGLSLWPGMINEIDTSTGNILSTQPWCLPYPIGFCDINNQLWGVSSMVTAGGTQRIYQFDSLLVSSVQVGISGSNLELQILPNPFTDELAVRSPEPGEIKIYDIYGRLVYAQQLTADHCQLTTGNWQQGIYFVEVITEEGRMERKVVKQ